jgi:hypothetical protein
MKKLSILLLAFVAVTAFAKPRVAPPAPKDCPDLSQVKFEIKTKQTKKGAKIEDAYTIKVLNGAKAKIKVTLILNPRTDGDAKIKKEVTIDESTTSKTVGGKAETTKGLQNVDITVELAEPNKCKNDKAKKVTLINQPFTVL